MIGPIMHSLSCTCSHYMSVYWRFSNSCQDMRHSPGLNCTVLLCVQCLFPCSSQLFMLILMFCCKLLSLFECGRYCHNKSSVYHVFILCGCPFNCQNNHTQVPVLTHSHVNIHSCDVSYLQSLSVSVSELKKPEPKPESKPQSNPVSKPVPKPHKAQERVSTNPLAPACSRSVASLPHRCLRLTTQQPRSMSAAIPHLLEGKVTALLLPVAFSGSVLCFSLYVFGYCNVERVIFFSFLGLSFKHQCLRCTLSHTNFYFMMLKGIFVVLCSAAFLLFFVREP